MSLNVKGTNQELTGKRREQIDTSSVWSVISFDMPHSTICQFETLFISLSCRWQYADCRGITVMIWLGRIAAYLLQQPEQLQITTLPTYISNTWKDHRQHDAKPLSPGKAGSPGGWHFTSRNEQNCVSICRPQQTGELNNFHSIMNVEYKRKKKMLNDSKIW